MINNDSQFTQQKIIQCMAVIDIDPALSHFRPTQQKWITSIQLFSEIPKEIKAGSKILNIFFGLYLVINFCQKNRLPIYQIDFINQPGQEWIPIKMPYNLVDKFVDSYLCYKTQQLDLMQPLGDIDVINTERKSQFGQDKEIVNVPNGYKVVSNPIFQSFLIYKRMKSRLQQTFKPIITDFYPTQNDINLGLIPLFCFPEGIKLSKELKGFITFSFILTQETGNRLYVTYLTFKQLLNDNLKNKLNVKIFDKIYYDKGICIISRYKFSDQFSESLQHLYRLSMSRNDQPFYRVIQNYISQLKLPKQTQTKGFSYSYNGCNIMFDYDFTLQTTSQKSIYCIFKFLPLQQILTIFKAILYQRQVIFVSQSKTVLGMAMEAFTSLIFPFKWENVIIPIVPLTMKQYLTAPVPFLAGITTVQLIDSSIQTQAVIVFLDSGKVMNDQDMPPLPEKLYKQLVKRLQQFSLYDSEQVRQYLQNPQNTYLFKMMQIQHPQFKGILIRQSFYQFFTTLMKNYKKYWRSKFLKDIKDSFSNVSTQPQLINQMFKVQDFLSDLGMNKIGSFGYKFTEGTIFTAYMQRRYQNSSDSVANFFDESLQKKKNKKFQGALLIKNEKIRYIVVKHPQPQKQKRFYSYERFPSILGEDLQKQIDEGQITLKLQEQQLLYESQFYEFIEQEFELNEGFYEEANYNDYKLSQNKELLNLLTNKNKEQFIGEINIKQNKEKKVFKIFRQIYENQSHQIQNLFVKWPDFTKKDPDLITIQKNQYIKLKLQNKLQNLDKDKILSIWNQQNLQIIIKGSIKILITSSVTNTSRTTLSKSTVKTSSLTTSTINKQHCVSLYIPSYRIRQFFNSKFKIQGQEIFSFIYNKVKNGSDNYWNIQTLIELRQFIEKAQNNILKGSISNDEQKNGEVDKNEKNEQKKGEESEEKFQQKKLENEENERV